MRFFTLIANATVLLTLLSFNASAGVYRWVDENGQVHFGAQPPQEKLRQAEQVELEVSKPAASAQQDSGTANKKEAEQEKPAEEKTELAGSVDAAKADEYCQRGRDFKATLATGNSRRYKRPDGSYRPLTDAERAEEAKKADNIISQYCSGK